MASTAELQNVINSSIASTNTLLSAPLVVGGPITDNTSLSAVRLQPAAGIARSADRTAATNGNGVVLTTDQLGQIATRPYAIPQQSFAAVTAADITNITATTVAASAGAGVRRYITSLGATNTSGTATRVDLLDGSTVVWTFFVAAGGGYQTTFPMPLRMSAATAVQAQCATTATATRVCIAGYTSTV